MKGITIVQARSLALKMHILTRSVRSRNDGGEYWGPGMCPKHTVLYEHIRKSTGAYFVPCGVCAYQT